MPHIQEKLAEQGFNDFDHDQNIADNYVLEKHANKKKLGINKKQK
jgi:hypothetical protein